ncbi:MAG: AMP-binding protein [Alphaproteobacteria bacterium]|jgi:fatty-acyl-CoA synthase|nr:AMP-binding protein [Alphaproteobacteria bacterium]
MAEQIRTLADVEAIESKPLDHLGLADTIYDAIRACALKHPDRVALYGLRTGAADEAPEAMTFAEYLDRLHRMANLLNRLGVGPDDAVTLLLPITNDAVVALWAAACAGISNPVNAFLEIDHLEAIARAAGTKVVVAWHPSVSPDSWARGLALKERLPELTLIQCGGDGHVEDGVVCLERAMAQENGDSLDRPIGKGPRDISAYLHTGGTTGLPKLARHTHQGQLLQSRCLEMMLGTDEHGVAMLSTPLFHVGGATIGTLAGLTQGGTTVALHPNGLRDRVAVRDFLRNAERFGTTMVGAVPAIWSALLSLPSDGIDLGTVKRGIVAAASVPAEMAQQAEDKFGFPLLEGWGMTEVHGFATMNPLAGENRNGSIGIRFPYTQTRIAQVDPDGAWRRDCDTDEIGVLLVKGPQVIAGYVDAAHNAGAWIDGDWLNTGDLARMDGDGYLWHVGRAKDLIIRGGHNIDPVLIEEVLYQHDGVELAAAVGQPDRRVGEMPVAYVQMRPGADFDAAALADFVRPRIQERAANPTAFFAVDEMPLTPVGKIHKPTLRLDAAKRVLAVELAALAQAGETVEVDVVADKAHGTLARINVSAGDAAAAEALAARCREAMAGHAIDGVVEIA